MLDLENFRTTLPVFTAQHLSQFLAEVRKAREMPDFFGKFITAVQNLSQEEANRVITDLESELYSRYNEVDSWLNLDQS